MQRMNNYAHKHKIDKLSTLYYNETCATKLGRFIFIFYDFIQ